MARGGAGPAQGHLGRIHSTSWLNPKLPWCIIYWQVQIYHTYHTYHITLHKTDPSLYSCMHSKFIILNFIYTMYCQFRNLKSKHFNLFHSSNTLNLLPFFSISLSYKERREGGSLATPLIRKSKLIVWHHPLLHPLRLARTSSIHWPTESEHLAQTPHRVIGS